MKKLLSLLLMLCITPSQLIVGAAAPAGAPAEFKESKEQKEMAYLRAIIAADPKFNCFSDAEYNDNANCGMTVDRIVQLFTGKHIIDSRIILKESENFLKAPEKPITLEKNEFLGSLVQLEHRDENFRLHPVAQSLMNDGTSPERSLFYICITSPAKEGAKHGNFHFFIILKFCDGENTRWYIVHSWSRYFTLSHWFGIIPWKLPTIDENLRRTDPARYERKLQAYENLNKSFELYNPTKDLRSRDINTFIRDPFGSALFNRGLYYIKKIDIPFPAAFMGIPAPATIGSPPKYEPKKESVKAEAAKPAVPEDDNTTGTHPLYYDPHGV